MKATINPSAPNRALNLSPVKETINTTKIVGLLDGFITVLTEPIDGYGEDAANKALLAIAQAIYPTATLVRVI